MIRSGIRQKQQGSLSSICLLCRHKSLFHYPGRRAYGWAPDRVPAAITGAPSFLALHATPSRASNPLGGGPESGVQNVSASGGAWGGGGGGGGWGSRSGLKRDPELEARKARDREEREAKERAVQEARLAKGRAEQEVRMAEEKARRAKDDAVRAEQQAIWARENQRFERTESNPGARQLFGNDRRGNFRLSGNFTNRENPSFPGFDRFGSRRRVELPPRPARQQPAGSEHLPWLPSQSRAQAPRDDENRSSGFWGQAEARVREQKTGRESRPGWSTSQDRWSTSRDSWSTPRNRPVDRLGFPGKSSGRDFDRASWGRDSPYPSLRQSQTTRRDEDKPSNNGVRRIPINSDSSQQSEARRGNGDEWLADPFRSIGRPDSQPQTVRSEGAWSEVLENKKIDPKPASPAAQNTAADWDWADTHLEKAESRTRQSPDESEEGDSREYIEARETSNELLARHGRREEDRFGRSDRSDRPERKEKRQGRPRPRQYENDEDGDVDLESIKERRRRKAERKAEKERARLAALEAAGPVRILLPEFISVSNLAVALSVKPKIFINQMMELGFEDVTSDSILTGETAAIIAEEYGFEPTVEEGEGRDLKPAPAPENPSSLPSRPPVVTIMGHVDHGKTTLLDYLRKSSVAAGEHGGITQHIGAFSVTLSSGKPITFLDTPGHAAFTAMRQRGANVTDIAILVVAADDSVKPQTIEALKHARAAKVPIIVAITKVDKPGANVDKVKSDLAGQGVEIEDYGGDVQVVGVSGKTGQGMEDLEENILLLADILDIRAETDSMAEGWVLESSIKPYGRAATILVKRGTLRVGDWIVAGTVSARVRILRNEAGVEVDEAPPGTAIEVLGWKDPPNAGDQVLQAPCKDKADDAVAYRLEQRDREEAVVQMAEQEQQKRERERERLAAEAAEAAGEEIEAPSEGGPKIVNFTVKGDVHGSVEAVCNAVQEIGNNEVQPKILMSSPGQITESDVDHAAVSGSCIINFNNPVSGHIKRLAINSKVRILDHNIIYHMSEEVKDVLSELLSPSISQKVVGEAEILQVFSINIKGRVYKNIAGCRIRNGQITRNSRVRVLRGDQELFTGPVETLKQGKKAVSEVKKGAECGVSFLEWEDFQQGDQIQVVEDVVTKRRLQ